MPTKATSCTDGKILNPKTNRCVKINGKIGIALVGKVVPQKNSNSKDKLFFYSSSADKAPGKGVNEVVANPKDYEQLVAYKDWRKVLSNFHVCDFKYKSFTYRTIEHAFQAAKIRIVDPVAAHRFCVESGDALGKADGHAARKARKLVDLKERISEWNRMSRKVMEEIARAKYAVCAEAKAILKATRNAELWHIVSRSKVHDHFVHLEKIRDGLKKDKRV